MRGVPPALIGEERVGGSPPRSRRSTAFCGVEHPAVEREGGRGAALGDDLRYDAHGWPLVTRPLGQRLQVDRAS